MAWMLVIAIGVVVGDLGYGLVMIAAALLLSGIGGESGRSATWGHPDQRTSLLLPAGIATAALGLLNGEFFGTVLGEWLSGALRAMSVGSLQLPLRRELAVANLIPLLILVWLLVLAWKVGVPALRGLTSGSPDSIPWRRWLPELLLPVDLIVLFALGEILMLLALIGTLVITKRTAPTDPGDMMLRTMIAAFCGAAVVDYVGSLAGISLGPPVGAVIATALYAGNAWLATAPLGAARG